MSAADVATSLRRLTVERPHDSLDITIDLDGSGDEQWFLLRSDAHHDSPYCDQKMERRHLEQARERDAGVLDFGDLFDAMQGPGDPRQDRSIIRTEEGRAAYFNHLMEKAVEFYQPYADSFVMLSRGNHETAPVKHYGVDLTDWLASSLGSTHVMPYRGFIRFQFLVAGQRRGSRTAAYTHGAGGGGPVTKGVIASQRRQSYIDCDLHISGHIHEKWHMVHTRMGLNHAGVIETREVPHITIPGYKDDTPKGDAWAATRDMPAKTTGAWWLGFTYRANEIVMELREAK